MRKTDTTIALMEFTEKYEKWTSKNLVPYRVMTLLQSSGEYICLNPAPSTFLFVCSYVNIPLFVISKIWRRLVWIYVYEDLLD